MDVRRFKTIHFPPASLELTWTFRPVVSCCCGMQPHPNPQTLDDLLANARHYAEYCMRGTGNLPPTLFLIGSDGKQVIFMPENLADVKAKNDFAAMSQLMAIASGATVAVLALEAWMKTANPGETLDTTEPPSEAFDRQEVIVLMGESMTEGRKNRCCPSFAATTTSSSASGILPSKKWINSKAGFHNCFRPRCRIKECASWRWRC
jgi:hypothetical protein